MNLRKTFFILPNLFTLASVFCGFFAIATVAAGGSAGPKQFYQAAIAIGFGFFFDLSDGRVARLTKTQSALGLQLDSLADIVTFGVAPALIVYRWGLYQLTSNIPHIGPHIGLGIAFLWLAAAALRLARFNVLAIKETEEKRAPGKFIIGLTVPAAASVLIGLVVLNYQLHDALVDLRRTALALIVVVLSYLMVSRVRFRSFKDLRPSRRTLTIGVIIAAASLILIFRERVPSAFVFMLLMVAYVALGLFEELIFYRRRRDEERAAKASKPEPMIADGGATSDEDVLEELGAYDDSEEPSTRR